MQQHIHVKFTLNLIANCPQLNCYVKQRAQASFVHFCEITMDGGRNLQSIWLKPVAKLNALWIKMVICISKSCLWAV